MNWEIDGGELDRYLASCKKAATDDNSFASFKRDKDFQVILEHISVGEGQYYADNTKNKFWLDSKPILDSFKENDYYGGADVHDYEGYGFISPSTVRYIKNVSDIASWLDDYEPQKIVEIGGGYGGLCKTVSCIYNFESYTFIDQPEVNMLSARYLSEFPEISKKVNHFSCYDFPEIKDIDLLISNYAVSELSLDSQKEYYDKVIKNATAVYVTYNNSQSAGYLEYFTGLLEQDFDFTISEDIGPNRIITGVKKRDIV